MTVPINSEVTLAGLFDFKGVGKVANLTELPDTFPTGNLANNKLIKCDQPVEVKFNWTVQGIFAHTMDPNSGWKIELFLEKYGPGEFAFQPGVGQKTVLYNTGAVSGIGLNAQVAYTGVTITIPPNTISEGIYDVVAAIRYLHPDGTPCFLAAFAEFGKIDFYQEH